MRTVSFNDVKAELIFRYHVGSKENYDLYWPHVSSSLKILLGRMDIENDDDFLSQLMDNEIAVLNDQFEKRA